MKRMFGEQRSRFSLRKYSFGVASVLLSAVIFGTGTAKADQVEPTADNQPIVTESTGSNVATTGIEESLSAPEVRDEPVAETTNLAPVQSSFRSTTDVNASGAVATTYEKIGDEIKVTHPEVALNFPDGTGKYSKFEIEYKNISIPDTITINQGDKVVLTLPEEVKFQTSYDFDVYNPDKQVVGKAVADATSGTLTTTFNDYFYHNPVNKMISLELEARWTEKVEAGKSVNIKFDGTNIHVDIQPSNPIPGNEVIDKWGSQDKDDPTIINWSMRINSSRRLLNNVRIIDTMSDNQVLVDDYLVINYIDSVDPWIDKGSAMELVKSISKSEHGFEIRMDRLDRMIYLWYKAKLVKPVAESTNPSNRVEVLADGTADHDTSRVQLVGGRGDASGDRATASPLDFHFELKKTLEGRELKDQEFTFKLEDITDPSAPADKGEVKNTADGKIILPTVTVSKAGTYKYRVTEISGSEAEMIYDPMVAEITVEVKEELVGNQPTLVSKIIYPEDIEFNNKLASPASAQIKFTKALAGRDLVAGEFQFELLDKDGKVVDTASNTVNGEVNFKPISYDKIGTYTYTVREVKGSDVSITYDPMVATVTVTVQKDGSSLVSTVQNPADTEFNNTYTLPTEAKAQIEFTKALAGRDLKAGEFTFVLKDGTGKEVERVTNTADGKVNFAELSFKEAGVYTYTVEEVAGKDEDLVYDPMIATVTITVTKNGNAFVATVTNSADTEFNNRLKEQEAGKAKFEFTKALAGRDLKAGEFSFVLKDESGRELQTVTNTADGKVSFDEITYDKVGTYKYTISEVAGSDVSIDYDKMVAEVTVTVTKEIGAEKNTFVAVKTLPADTEFNNTYIAPTKAQFTFTKALSGRELKDKEFMFALFERNENGQDVFLGFAQNDANGQVAFDAIDYDAEGTHNYYVVEVIGNDAAVTYDRMEAEVTVTVTKNPATNSLEATVVMPADSEFNNSVTPPTPPTPPSPYIPPKPGEPTPPAPPAPNTPPKPGEPTPPTPPSPNTPSKPGERTPKKPQLPNTGTASDSAALAGLGLMGVLAGFGLARKKKED